MCLSIGSLNDLKARMLISTDMLTVNSLREFNELNVTVYRWRRACRNFYFPHLCSSEKAPNYIITVICWFVSDSDSKSHLAPYICLWVIEFVIVMSCVNENWRMIFVSINVEELFLIYHIDLTIYSGSNSVAAVCIAYATSSWYKHVIWTTPSEVEYIG